MAHGHTKSQFYFVSLPPLGVLEVIFGIYAYLSEP